MSAYVPIIEVREILAGERADLEIIPIGGWRVCTQKGAFRVHERAVFIEPDYCVPTSRPEFAFLASEGRTKCRLRSPLLIHLPDRLHHLNTGDNVMHALGIERYAPLLQTGVRSLPLKQHPRRYAPIFGTETYQNAAVEPGTPVIVTEKVHGAGARYLCHDGRMFVGSRERWLHMDDPHIWAAALTPEIREWCADHPDVILFGEVYGNVQSLKYGRKDTVAFVGFAALTLERWAPQLALFATLESFGVPHVPLLHAGAWSEDLLALAERHSAVPGAPAEHMREGVVIVPDEERSARQSNGARKYISARYWAKPLDEKVDAYDSTSVGQSGSASEDFLHEMCASLWGKHQHARWGRKPPPQRCERTS